ncbi:MAG: aminotransferase class V-fold PLP-dependent enzyme [Candidatus Woesearchaeota archaeon]
MNTSKIREDFPILNNPKKPVIYFDNACMTLRPKQVIDKMNQYYYEYPACAERSHHKLGKRATEEYNNARENVRKFINAKSDKEIIFTKNTTESINLISKSFGFRRDDLIISTDKEHNSNLLPWQMVAREKGLRRERVSTKNGFDMITFEQLLKKGRSGSNKIFVSMMHTSNMDGTSIPVKEIINIAHQYDAIVMLDGAQSVPHQPIDVKKMDIDLLAFSGHKMLGPSGTGVLYGKEELLQKLSLYNVGGSTVEDSTYDDAMFSALPERFEAGLQDYGGFIGLGEAVTYLKKYIDDIHEHELKLNKIATEGLKSHVNILGPEDSRLRSGIFSFNTKNNMDFHEVALMLDSYANIMIRSGRHCVHSWFNANKIDGSARASFYLYNTEDEAKLFVEKMKEVIKMK